MIEIILMKAMIFILSFSIVFLLREAFLFYASLRRGERETLKTGKLWGIGLAISFIVMVIITGLTL